MSELTYDWIAGKPKTVPMDQLPPKVYEKAGLRIVDLTKVIDPSNESRRCNLWRFNTGGDCAQWLADHQVQAVGFGDGVAIEGLPGFTR